VFTFTRGIYRRTYLALILDAVVDKVLHTISTKCTTTAAAAAGGGGAAAATITLVN